MAGRTDWAGVSEWIWIAQTVHCLRRKPSSSVQISRMAFTMTTRSTQTHWRLSRSSIGRSPSDGNWMPASGLKRHATITRTASLTSPPALLQPAPAASTVPPARRTASAIWTGNVALSHHSEDRTVFVKAARGFRAPQTTELYRLQSGQTIADIDSETIDSLEMGIRGAVSNLNYEFAAYWMTKENVIFQDRDRYNVSGAETEHRGLEFTLTGPLTSCGRSEATVAMPVTAMTATSHYWDHGDRFKGNDIDTAPRHFGSVQLMADFASRGQPIRAEIEWLWVAKYWLDPNNQHEYGGHELLNLRAAWDITPSLTVTLVATNLRDEGYAERADLVLAAIDTLWASPAARFWASHSRCSA